jgi:stearoyl-CoA desaturase (delta-9 desaturase)
LQYRRATEKCKSRQASDKWHQLLEQEYRQFLRILQLWSEHRQAWYEARGQQIQKTREHWDQLQLRDRYREMQYRLKMQRRRWQQLMRKLAKPLPYPA